MRDIVFEILPPGGIDFDILAPDGICMDISGSPVMHLDPYAGPYEVTPTRQTQILETDGKTMTADVVVNPIPPNYGLIEYDGFRIRVS